MKLIQHQNLSSGQSAITLSSIPQEYTDLVLVFSLRSNNASYAFDDIGLRINNDSTSNYQNCFFRNREGGVGTFRGTGTSATIFGAPSAGAVGNAFGNGMAYIPNYASSGPKTISTEGYSENTSSTGIQNGYAAVTWNGTDPVTSLTIVSLNGWDFVINSSVSLYGITKGSDGVTTVS